MAHRLRTFLVSLPPWVVAAAVALMGFVNIISAVLVHNPPRMVIVHEYLAWALPGASRTVSVVAGAFLILLARGLRRRKRQAWLLALALLGISMVAHLTKGLDVEEMGGALGLAAVLVILRGHYTVRSDPQILQRAYVATAGAFLLLITYSVAGMVLLHSQFAIRHDVLAPVLGGFSLLTGYDWAMPLTRRAMWFLHSVIWLGGATLLYAALAVLRPVLAALRPRESERRLAADALQDYGVNPISPYVVDEDKALFIGPDESGVVAYAVAGGVAIAAGDPLGPADQRETLIDAFVAFCRHQDWVPAFYEVMPEEEERYRRRGFRLLKIGEDAVIDLRAFTLSGKKIANVRHCVTHCERAGLTTEVFATGIAAEATVNALEEVSTRWLAGKSGPEMGFSLGTFSREALRRNAVAVARDETGQPIAFVTWRRFGGEYGVALDLMRRADNVPSGTMDYLIARSLLQFQQHGIRVASLGLAPLANTREGAHGWLEQGVGSGMEWVFNNLNGIYRYKSLYFFKRKFNPRWEPRYLACPGGTALPGVLYALVRVHLPSALVSLPRLAHLPGRRVEGPHAASHAPDE